MPQATLLATASAILVTPLKTIKIRLLIDTGSEVSLVSEHLIKQAALNRSHSATTITGIGGKTPIKSRGTALLSLQSLHSEARITVRAQILPTLNLQLPSSQVTSEPWSHPKQLKLADPEFFLPQPIDLVLGADYYGQIIKPNIIKDSLTTPIAQLSIFGWLIIGPVAEMSPQALRQSLHVTQPSQNEEHLDKLLTRFWVQEEVPTDTQPLLTAEEEQCEEHFKTTHQRDTTGRYVVRLPLTNDNPMLGDSYRAAYRRLQHALKKFKDNPEYQTLYTDFMKTYEDLGHMALVPPTPWIVNHADGSEPTDPSPGMTLAPGTSVPGGLRVPMGRPKERTLARTPYYLPHHGVLRPESSSTKLRVVFDGSCASSSGKSLNDFLHIGAKIQPDITNVLLWIRQHALIFATDITKMFRQINVHPDDWDLQRILWTDNEKIVPYHLTTVTYGTRSAPFLAVRVLQQLVEDEGEKYPLAVPALKFGRYVDDIFGGADTAPQLALIADQLNQLCTAGGFPLAKWHSNCPEALKVISPTELNETSIQLGDCTSKILGLY